LSSNPEKPPASGRNTRIVGTGSYVPERILTNADLEKIVDTTDEWILTRTGIRERRISSSDQASSDLAEAACRLALEDARVDPAGLDAIIVATVTPDHMFPSTACLLQHRLGASGAFAFDISAACSGFLYALHVARAMINSNQAESILVAGVESLSKITDYTDRSTCILFGDGAGAAVLGPGAVGEGILGSVLRADGRYGDLIIQPAGGSRIPMSREAFEKRQIYLHMKGNEVFRIGVRAMGDSCLRVLDQAGLTPADVDILIPHQANLRMIEATAKRLEIPMEKVVRNIQRYGNTSAASVAIGLDETRREGRIQKGDIVLTVAFGGGVTWAANVMRWA
jgi:3-oxoacyl-[acyl-carrier-protein] synthase-3